jgi:subtilisin family serine protease
MLRNGLYRNGLAVRFAVLALVVSCGTHAAVADNVIGGGGDCGEWKAEWRKTRNALVEAKKDLAFDPTSILVKFNDGTKEADVALALGVIGGQVIETWELVPGLYHVAVGDVDDALAKLNIINDAAKTIEYAEPDLLYKIYATPNDPLFSLQWGLNNTGQTVNGDPGTANADMDGPEAWDFVTGGNFVVGMADSGIRRTHEDLSANIWTNPGEIAGNGRDDDGNGYVDDTWGWDFWNNDNNPSDDNGHGSHTAGTVGAVGNNGRGVAGVCWSVKMAGLKIGSASGSISTSAAVSALNYCRGKGIRLSNHSWGGGGFSSSLNTAITNARTAGHLLICAAGNGGADGRGDNNDSVPQYPASYTQDNIISVAALDNDDRLAGFSNYGATSVDVGAPGVMIASTYNSSNSSYVYLDGTSMATPHVTGVAALVWIRNPGFSYSQVRSRILTTGYSVSALSGRSTTGRAVDAWFAVR